MTRATGLVVAAAALAQSAAAQSLLDRPPNLSADWVGTSGTLYFHFVHRFSASSMPERKVSNVPTFAMALGLPARTLVGAHYATNSQLAPRYPNEWEFFARAAPFAQENGAPVDLGGQVGYNVAAEGVDGELSLARRQGALRVIAVARVLADPYVAGRTRMAIGGGATFRLGGHVALAGDWVTLANREGTEQAAWSAGLHLALPSTPHTLSLHASNVTATTLQGASRGVEQVRYGFEFTVPVTLRRYFGGRGTAPTPRADPPPVTPRAGAAAEAGAVASAGVKGFAYTPTRIEITAGTTVEWKNGDPVAHTVTAADQSFDSGLIQPGATWRHTFATPGTYDFLCTPHPFMKGVVVVR